MSEKTKKSCIWDFDGTGRLTIRNLMNFLKKQNISVKLNAISHEIEISGHAGTYEIKNLGTAPTVIWDFLAPLKYCTTDMIAKMLEVIALQNEYNPVLDMIKMAKWDGQDRIAQLCELLNVRDDLSKLFIKKWLMQCVCGLMNDEKRPFSLDMVLVFTGKQGIGKTRLLEHLALDPQFFCEGTAIDPSDKDSVRRATGCWICELGEIGSTMKKEIDMLKAFISNTKDVYRKPYARGQDKYIRRTSFCGTGNSSEYLIDDTGNRRFLTVQLDDNLQISMADIKKLDALQLWSQVYNMIQTSGKNVSDVFRFTMEERIALDERNKNHLKLLKGEQEVMDCLAYLEKPEEHRQRYYEYITVTEFIQQNYQFLHGYTAQQISKCLEKLGYPQVRKRLRGSSEPCKCRKLIVKRDIYPTTPDIIDNTTDG